MAIIGKINGKVLIDDLVLREKKPEEIKWLTGGRQQGKTYQLIKDQQQEILRLNNIIDELEKDIQKRNKKLNTSDDYERFARLEVIDTIDKLKELKEGQ